MNACRKAFKQNFKASILPGVLYCVVVTVQIFLVYFCFNLLYHGTNVGVGMWVATVLNLVIFHMLLLLHVGPRWVAAGQGLWPDAQEQRQLPDRAPAPTHWPRLS